MASSIWYSNGKINIEKDFYDFPPIIKPILGFSIYINGIKCEDSITVNINDKIVIQHDIIEYPKKIDVIVSEDNMKVKLICQHGKKIKKLISDSQPNKVLTLHTKDLYVGRNPISKGEIINKLNEIGIKIFSVDAIDNICNNKLDGEFLIGSGKLPTQPIDDNIEILIDNSNNYVDTDSKIAKIMRGKSGINGVDVYGNTIYANSIKELNIDTDDNFKIADNFIYSTQKVIPRIFMDENTIVFKSILVNSISEISASIYSGDIVAKENVSNTKNLISINRLNIDRNVMFSSIKCYSDINISKDVISSHITTYSQSKLFYEIKRNITIIYNALSKIYRGLNFNDNENIFKNLYTYFKRDNCITRSLNILMEYTSENNYYINSEIIKIIQQIDSIKSNYIITKSDLKLMLENINNLKYRNLNIDSNIELNSVTNSQLYSANDIKINNNCYNTKINSNGCVIIGGTLVGGEIFAANNITINNIGESKDPVRLYLLNKDGTINIKKNNAKLIININRSMIELNENAENLLIRQINNKIVF